MRAKICGITTHHDAMAAANLGAWAVGFNFFPQSPRYIPPKAAKPIIQQLPRDLVKVGIVIGTPAKELAALMAFTGVDLLQVYENHAVSAALKKRMIWALHAADIQDLPAADVLAEYNALLLDAPQLSDGLLGGTGRTCNWDLAMYLAQHYPLILAGGLGPHNVAAAISKVGPYAVDVASGVQSNPGKIDIALLTQFLNEVKHA